MSYALSPRGQKNLSILTISAISFAGLESLIYINNLYQPQVYIQLSGFVYLIMLFWMYFIFDLHLRRNHLDAPSIAKALGARFKHFASWKNFRHFQNYLILPGLLYWGSVILIAINFRHFYLQQFVAIVSSVSLICSYTFFKELFKNEFQVQTTHFFILSYVKLYAAWLVYAAALGIVWYYCFPPSFFYLVIFISTFMLLHQALFQFCKISFSHFLQVFGISLLVAASSFVVYKYWNVNYFTAGLFMAAVYNLLWNIFYHKINKTSSREIVLEQVAIFILITVMVLGTTNFNARIGRCLT